MQLRQVIHEAKTGVYGSVPVEIIERMERASKDSDLKLYNVIGQMEAKEENYKKRVDELSTTLMVMRGEINYTVVIQETESPNTKITISPSSAEIRIKFSHESSSKVRDDILGYVKETLIPFLQEHRTEIRGTFRGNIKFSLKHNHYVCRLISQFGSKFTITHTFI
jgi:pyruvate kinase